MTTVYEIKSDMAVIRERTTTVERMNERVAALEGLFIAIQTDYMPPSSGISSTMIYVMVVGAIVALALMAIITGQIHLPG